MCHPLKTARLFRITAVDLVNQGEFNFYTMARILGAKCKQCRREEQKLFLKGERCFSPKCAIVKRNYPPGVHGPTARIKHSDYGVRLREKQKAKRIYRILERQFRNYFVDALKEKGKTGEHLLRLVEQRFDNVIYRAGFA